jgi:hypothetical protein
MDDQTHATPSTPTAPTTGAPRKKARRGFAAMPADTQRRLAALGGKASHAKGMTTHVGYIERAEGR